MPSSTSSSKPRSENAAALSEIRGPTARGWATGTFLAAVVLLGMEVGWRTLGHEPSVVDGYDMWSAQRERIKPSGPRTLALIGASRMLLDFSLPTCRELLPTHDVVQLAVAGTAPLAALEDLARDPLFQGVVLCDIHAGGFLKRNHDRQQDYVNFYHEQWRADRHWNFQARLAFQQRLVLLSPQVGLTAVARHLLSRGRLPPPYYLTITPDRSYDADYRQRGVASVLQNDAYWQDLERRLADVPPPAAWLEDALVAEPWIRKIQHRGGQVVFIRFPTTGRRWELDEQYRPRKLYWDRLAENTAAATLHFRDVSGMAEVECPDTSHLDFRDKSGFTRALLDELMRRGTLFPSAGH